jgi:phosphate transport system permease protein
MRLRATQLRLLSLIIVGAVVASAVQLGGIHDAAAADVATFRLDPATQNVSGGQTFNVDVLQNAGVETTGAQFNLLFNPALVKVTGMQLGEAYGAGAMAFGTTDDGSNKSVAAELTKANQTGVLLNIAAFLLPGSGAVPAGDAVVFRFTFQGVAGPGGTTNLEIAAQVRSALQVLDTGGNVLPVTATGGSVDVSRAAGATGPPITPAPEMTPIASPTAPVSLAGTADLTINPPGMSLNGGDEITVDLRVATATPIQHVVGDVQFDRTALRVVAVQFPSSWSEQDTVLGLPQQTKDQALDGANGTGTLSGIGLNLASDAAILPPGDGTFARVTFKALAPATTDITYGQIFVWDINGVALTTTSQPAHVTIIAASGGADPLLVAGLAAIAMVLVAAARRTRSRRALRRPSLPYLIALALALIPVLAFVGIVVVLIQNSAQAFERPGISGLLGDQFSSRFSGINLGLFGLLPAAYGTVFIAFIAIVIATPVALAMALVVTEFSPGRVGLFLRPLIEVMAGIPPILYAVSGAIFVSLIMIPKFAASSTFPLHPETIGADPSQWPPPNVPYNPGAYPWDPSGTTNSTLLGGALIALLIIPFLTPLLVDAIRNVPTLAREASFALGANRRYTVRRILLPLAAPAIVSSIALAALKAIGDTLIVALVVGWEAQRIPNPFFDALERTPSLAAVGAGLLGGFQAAGAACSPTECAVGYATALALLLVAASVVAVMTIAQAFWRRRVLA